MSLNFVPLEIEDVLLISSEKHTDERGFFVEIFKYTDYLDLGLPTDFVQDNLVHSKQNVLRGLHYQNKEMSQGKLVSLVKGSIFDVAVDIRPESNTYGRHVSVILSDNKCESLFIPSGFAHGYSVLSDYAIVTYKTTKEYSPTNECGIIWNDSTLGIDWPTKNPFLSTKDKSWDNFNALASNSV